MSVIITTSDASIADSEPTPPIEIPTSALAKTGESFIPSPTNATFDFSSFLFIISSNALYLSCGNISDFIFCIPISFPVFSAICLLSPVNIFVLIPSAFSSFIVSTTPSFTVSPK